MIVNKIIVGFIIQSYDTIKQKFVSQEFVSGEECWETIDHYPLDNEPTDNLKIELNQPIPYNPNDVVLVTPNETNLADQEFTGKVIDIINDTYVRVTDQDGNVYDCDPSEVNLVKD